MKGNQNENRQCPLISFFLIQCLFAQGGTPKDWGLKGFRIKDAQLGAINYYVTEKGIDQEKPI
jgi:hypothetical protein